jgi:uncharacterized hydrophobic protein (TIGR00271 family)
MDFLLIYDPERLDVVEGVILPQMGSGITGVIPFNLETTAELAEGTSVLLYLSDNQIKNFLSGAGAKSMTLALLPHEQAREICFGWGVHFDLQKAIENLLSLPEALDIDVMYCNGRPVFNSIVIGDAFQLVASSISNKTGWWNRTRLYFKRFFNMQPFDITIGLKEDKNIRTAVSGIVVMQHSKSSLLTRLILEDSAVNDGMTHFFLMSPKSMMNLIWDTLLSWRSKGRLPGFAGHIKTDRLTLSREKGIDYLEDNVRQSALQLEFEVRKQEIRIIPGQFLKVSNGTGEVKEVFKIQSLPGGEAVGEYISDTLPLITHAATEEFKELFTILRDHAKLKSTFLVLMVLSTLLATLGLFSNSPPVVIGAMILAPLMAPIISLSMGTLRQEHNLILQSLKTIEIGLAVAFACAVILTWLTPIKTYNAEILARTRPNLLDLGIAVISGIAGAYAHAREEVAKTLAGVAIAVALVPPLAVSGIGLGRGDWDVFLGATLLLSTNLAGIVLAGALTFLLLGFSPFKLARKGVLIATAITVIISIPLGLGFRQMVYEHRIVQALDALKTENGIIKDVKVDQLKPLSLSLKVVSEEPLTNENLDLMKLQVELLLNRPVSLEVTTAIKR